MANTISVLTAWWFRARLDIRRWSVAVDSIVGWSRIVAYSPSVLHSTIAASHAACGILGPVAPGTVDRWKYNAYWTNMIICVDGLLRENFEYVNPLIISIICVTVHARHLWYVFLRNDRERHGILWDFFVVNTCFYLCFCMRYNIMWEAFVNGILESCMWKTFTNGFSEIDNMNCKLDRSWYYRDSYYILERLRIVLVLLNKMHLFELYNTGFVKGDRYVTDICNIICEGYVLRLIFHRN